MHSGTYYSISTEMVLEWRYGPFGLFKKTETIITQTGRLYPGSTVDLYDAEKVRVGVATLAEEGILKVVLEGDLQGVEVSISTIDANDVVRRICASDPGTYEIVGDMTIKSRGGRKKVHLKRHILRKLHLL